MCCPLPTPSPSLLVVNNKVFVCHVTAASQPCSKYRLDTSSKTVHQPSFISSLFSPLVSTTLATCRKNTFRGHTLSSWYDCIVCLISSTQASIVDLHSTKDPRLFVDRSAFSSLNLFQGMKLEIKVQCRRSDGHLCWPVEKRLSQESSPPYSTMPKRLTI